MSLIVYGGSISPFVRKVRVVLIEKGLDYRLDPVNPFAPQPEFLGISPLKRIPVLRDTDQAEPNTLPDSSVICDYLEHKYPEPALYPKTVFARARALWFEEYADSAVAETIGRGLFFERIVKRMLRQEPDEAVCSKTLTQRIPPLFDYLEREIGPHQFLVEERFSIADITVGSMFVNFLHAGEVPSKDRWPQLAAYVTRIHARPSFAALMEEENRLIASLRKAQ